MIYLVTLIQGDMRTNRKVIAFNPAQALLTGIRIATVSNGPVAVICKPILEAA